MEAIVVFHDFFIMYLTEALKKFNEWKGVEVKKGTIKGYELALRQFSLFVRNKPIEDVHIEDVTSWFRIMRDLEWDRNSLIPKAMALRKLFEFYRRQGYRVLDPLLIPIPKKEYKFPRVVTEEQYRKLLGVIPDETNDPRFIRNRAFINLLWDTGARNGELLTLNIGDLDLENKRAQIKTEKSQGARPTRMIFWEEETNNSLIQWLKKREHLQKKFVLKEPDALFISATSAKAGERLTIKGTCEMLRVYSRKAGIPYVNAHSFRHHMGHDLAKKKANNAIISNVLGHSSLQSSFVYTMLNDNELEETYREYRRK